MTRKGGGKPRVLVAHGVNLDLLGRREPDVYGAETLADVEAALKAAAPALAALAGFTGVELTFLQTNVEAEYLAALDGGYDGAVLNPGAWTHTSLALADRLRGLSLPFVEVHLSNLAGREDYRQTSFAAPYAVGLVSGMRGVSYHAGLLGLLHHLKAAKG